MSKCPFYQIHMHPSSGKADAPHNPHAWCSHAHSAVSVQAAIQTTSGQALKCEGDVAKCILPPEWRPPSWLA
jgi:hypothetical protein